MRELQPEDYLFKTDPYTHQRTAFNMGRDREEFAYLMEMGTGKTKVTIDDAAYNYQHGNIECLIIVAPNGVHRNWTKEGGECDVHMPDWTKYRCATWASSMKAADRKACEAMFDDWEGLRVVALNVEAFRDATKCKAAKYVRSLLMRFKCMMAVDESSWIKTPGAKRTKALTVLGQQCVLRRILTGTPVTQGPLDIYAQFRFLGPNLLGFDNYYSFKHYYADWRQERTRQGQRYEVLEGYKNIDELVGVVDKNGFRITKEECLDLPEKVYMTRYVALSKEQRKWYNEISSRLMIELDNGEELNVSNVLTKALRLQQVLGGFLPKEEYGDALPIEGGNPRIQCLLDCLEETSGKVIIWARFRAELAAIEDALREKYGRDSVVSYHGGVDNETRKDNIKRFQEGECRFFVGQQHAGGYGITLTAANTVIYYSNDFSLEARLQSEDRAHRIGQKHNVTYIDIECTGTIDTKIIQALRAKQSLADMVTRDSVRQLLARAA